MIMSQRQNSTGNYIAPLVVLIVILAGLFYLGVATGSPILCSNSYVQNLNLCPTTTATMTTTTTRSTTTTISSTITTTSSSVTTATTTTISSTTTSVQTSNTAQQCASGLTVTIHVENPADSSPVPNDHVSVVNSNGNPNYSASGITDANGNFVYCGFPNVQYVATEILTGGSLIYSTYITNTSTETFVLFLQFSYVPGSGSAFAIGPVTVSGLQVIGAAVLTIVVIGLAIG